MTREELERQIEWLESAYEQADLPRSWKADSIKRTRQQIDDIRWRLETEPPREAPMCGWTKPYREHPADCPQCASAQKRIDRNLRIQAGLGSEDDV